MLNLRVPFHLFSTVTLESEVLMKDELLNIIENINNDDLLRYLLKFVRESIKFWKI